MKTTKDTKVFATIRNRIFAGILFVTPVMATIWIFNFLLNLVTGWFPRRHFPTLNKMMGGYLLTLLVLLFLILAFYGIGALSLYLGKRATRAVDNLFGNIPIVKTIYKFLKQFRDWVANRNESMFSSVVLVRYPHANSYAIGLMTAVTPTVIADHILGEDGQPLACVNVFIATTPNPTSGFFLIYPKREVTFLNIEVSSAMNLIISAGAIMNELPPEIEAARPHDH